MKQRAFKRTSNLQQKILAILTVFVLTLTTLAGNGSYSVFAANNPSTPYIIQLSSNTSSSTGSVGPCANMKDGAILHAWCWSFNTIKNNMKQIADAGYTSIQTSPANACVVGNGGDKKFKDQWWYHYQPTDYTIGNYQLGSEAELKAMCQEADKYGINIIVDVVANHCTSTYSLISNNLKRIPNAFHTNKEIKDWNSRYQVTQLALMGLYDNNTHNKEIQNYILRYLNQCVADGADGFRYDAAKHIELPDDQGFGSDFWPTILRNGSKFQYGETLQDSISREGAYANYMSVTASSYGKKLRDLIGENNFNAGRIGSYDIGVDASKLVTWVESHDNYANGIDEWGSSQWMNDEQVKLCWAVVGARAGGTPLFFSRPVGGGGKSWDSRFPELTKIGDRGSDLFMDDEVAAVNKFRNAMVGENEYLRNPDGNSKVLMIERGKKGVVIVNLNGYETTVNSITNLANGTYINATDNNNVFTVSGGRISGKVPARSVAVLYSHAADGPVVEISNPVSSFKTDSLTLTLVKKNANKATYSINGGQSYLYENGDTITFGANQPYNTTFKIELRGINDEGVTTSKTYEIIKKDPNAKTTVYFQKPSNWSDSVKAYVYNDSQTPVVKNADWPGVSMSYDGTTGLYKYILNDQMTSGKIIFTDGTNQIPNANLPGFDLKDGGAYNSNGLFKVITDIPTPTPTPSESTESTKITFEKPSYFGNTVYAYVYDESRETVVNNADWPGVPMTANGDGTYSYQVSKSTFTNLSNAKVIFTDNNN